MSAPPLTPNDLNPPEAAFPEFHSVYIDPVSYEHYRQTGTFQDGTTLIKELVSVGSKQAVSGNGYFMGEFVGLEAAVKSASTFPMHLVIGPTSVSVMPIRWPTRRRRSTGRPAAPLTRRPPRMTLSLRSTTPSSGRAERLALHPPAQCSRERVGPRWCGRPKYSEKRSST